MPKLVRGLLFAAMPLIVYFALQELEPRAVGLCVLALLLLRDPHAALAFVRTRRGARAWLVAAAAMGAGAVLWHSNDPRWVLAYPVLVNLLMLGVFAGSLLRPPSIIERIARLREPHLPPAGVTYTRRVTLVWCVFFALNGAVAAWTVMAASRETWVLYNGLVSYLLMGALFAAEWVFRRYHLHSGAVR